MLCGPALLSSDAISDPDEERVNLAWWWTAPWADWIFAEPSKRAEIKRIVCTFGSQISRASAVRLCSMISAVYQRLGSADARLTRLDTPLDSSVLCVMHVWPCSTFSSSVAESGCTTERPARMSVDQTDRWFGEASDRRAAVQARARQRLLDVCPSNHDLDRLPKTIRARYRSQVRDASKCIFSLHRLQVRSH